MSLAGIVFGVGFIVLTQAVTSGFQKFFVETILGADGAIRVEDKIQLMSMEIQAEGIDKAKKALFSSVKVESDRKYQAGVFEPQLQMAAIRPIAQVKGVSEVLRGNVTIQSHNDCSSSSISSLALRLHSNSL